MNRISIVFIVMICVSINLSSQNVSGTWRGVFYAPYKNITYPYFFFMDLKQKGSVILGVYSTGDSNNTKSISCLTSVSAKLSKHPTSIIDLYKERVEYFDNKNVSYEICNFVNRLSLHYFIIGNSEYFTGKWFSSMENGPGENSSGGVIVLQRISMEPLRSIEQYFKKTDQMIRKSDVNNVYEVKADSIIVATPTEKKLIHLMQKALSNIIIKP